MSGVEMRELFLARMDVFRAVQARDGFVTSATLLAQAPQLFQPAPSRHDTAAQRACNWLLKTEDRGVIERESFKRKKNIRFVLTPMAACPNCKGTGQCAQA